MRYLFVVALALGGCSGFEAVADSGAVDSGDVDHSSDKDHAIADQASGSKACPGPIWAELIGESFSSYSAMTAIAIDATGALHIAFAPIEEQQQGIRYTRQVGDAWSAPELVANDDGRYPTLAVTSDGKAHIVYFREGVDVVHAWTAPDGSFEQATLTGHRGVPTLTVDGSGDLHLATAGGNKTVYRQLSDGSWKDPIELDTATFLGSPVGIATWGGQVAVGYCDDAGTVKVRVATIGEPFGDAVEIAQDLDDSRVVTLDVDADGDLHLLYAEYRTLKATLHYTFQTDGKFGAPVALTDAQGHATTTGGVDLMTRNEHQWILFVSTNGRVGTIHGRDSVFSEPTVHAYAASNPAGVVDANGALHVSSWSSTTKKLQHLRICP